MIGTQALCHTLGIENAIAFDMGGTTAKAGVIYKGEALTTGAALIGGYDKALPVQIAMMDIFEVGTGGGSIARVEDGALARRPAERGRAAGPGLLRPRRRGADRDRRQPRARPARRRPLPRRRDAARRQRPPSARSPAGRQAARHDATEAADGILRIAATAMSYAVKGVTTERGLDAGDFALVAYGGAGPLHAVAVAREIGIRNVIIPAAPGVFSAFGMLFSDLRYDFVRTALMRLDDAPFDDIEQVSSRTRGAGPRRHRRDVGQAAEDRGEARRRHALCRPGARGHGRPAAGVFARQDRRRSSGISTTMHMLRYGTSAPEEHAEIVSLRTTVTGLMQQAAAGKIKRGRRRRRSRRSPASGRSLSTQLPDAPTWRRAELLAGNRIKGPALIEEHASTTVLMPGDAWRSTPTAIW